MLHLLQLYKMVKNKKLFIAVFSDFAMECDDMNYTGFEGEIFNEMLLNHFGMEIECEKQLKRVTDKLLTKNDLSFLLYM